MEDGLDRNALGKLPLLAGFVALFSVYLFFESVREVRFLVSSREALADVGAVEPRKVGKSRGSDAEVVVYDVEIRLKDPALSAVRVEWLEIDTLDRMEPTNENWVGMERWRATREGGLIPSNVRGLRVEFVPGVDGMVRLVGQSRRWTVYLLGATVVVLVGLIGAGLWRFRHVKAHGVA